MRILFIGGTGIISTACTAAAVQAGHDVTVLNRGRRSERAAGVKTIQADVTDETSFASAVQGQQWDVVVNFLAFQANDVTRDVRLFKGQVGQYYFISSASAYQRPARHYLVTESTPLVNPLWQYSRDKIAGEAALMEAVRDGFPGIIIRPSLTYGDTQFTLPMNSWQKSYTVVDRLRRGAPVIIPGDGSSLWTITHNTDFAAALLGLFGNPQAVGHAFHITSDEVMTWDQYHLLTARAASVRDPQFVHIASDFIVACLPGMQGTLLGDKGTSAVFDNSKIKRFVPGWHAKVRFVEGIARTVAWHDADASRRQVDEAANQDWDRILKAYNAGLEAARQLFPQSGG